MDDTYFVYAEYDPGCSCCRWEYKYEEFEKFEDAKKFVKELKAKGFSVTLIKGTEVYVSFE